MITEVPEDGEEDEPEMIPAETQHETAVVKPALEDILQTQAGCFVKRPKRWGFQAKIWNV